MLWIKGASKSIWKYFPPQAETGDCCCECCAASKKRESVREKKLGEDIFMGGVTAGGGKQAWVLGSSGRPVVTLVYCAGNATPLTLSSRLTLWWVTQGLFPALLVPFCNGNNLVKSQTWSVEPLAVGDYSHLDGRCPSWPWREPPRFLIANRVHLLGCRFCDAHLLVIPARGRFTKWTTPCWNDGEDHFGVAGGRSHPLLYPNHLCRGRVLLKTGDAVRSWDMLLLPGSSGGALSLTWPPLLFWGVEGFVASVWNRKNLVFGCHALTQIFYMALVKLLDPPVFQFPMGILRFPLPWGCAPYCLWGARGSQERGMLHDLATLCAINSSQQDASPFPFCKHVAHWWNLLFSQCWLQIFFLRAGKYVHLMMPLLQNKFAFRRCITQPQAHQWVTNLVCKGTVNSPQVLEVLQDRLVLQFFGLLPLSPGHVQYITLSWTMSTKNQIFFFLWLAWWKPEIFWAEERIASVT